MSRKWIEYSEEAPAGREELYVSLTPQGRMLVAKTAHEAIGQPAQVVLLFDPESNTIGIRPAPPNATNAFVLHPSSRFGAYLISAMRFLRKHNIRLDQTVRFPLAHVEDGILILDLHTKVPVVTGRRRAPAFSYDGMGQ